jgi:hypothetical protein
VGIVVLGFIFSRNCRDSLVGEALLFPDFPDFVSPIVDNRHLVLAYFFSQCLSEIGVRRYLYYLCDWLAKLCLRLAVELSLRNYLRTA